MTDPKPLWLSNEFTDEERSTMLEMTMGVIRDDIKAVAIDMLDDMELTELFDYMGNDHEVTAECLRALADGTTSMDDYESGEHPEHVDAAAFIKRFKLWDNGCITPLGEEFIRIYG